KNAPPSLASASSRRPARSRTRSRKRASRTSATPAGDAMRSVPPVFVTRTAPSARPAPATRAATQVDAIPRKNVVRSRTMAFDLRDPSFYDEDALDRELVRIFDICHGCRMCFNYCPSFPVLFDAIDQHELRSEGETQALTHAEKWKVVDLCYQCKLCYVKCPYTPPHEFNVDFPRLMLRAKATRAKREGVTRQDRFLGDPDRTARRSTGVAARLVNWANGQKALRAVVESTIGIHRDRV